MARVILHIGAHKTGTTFLQRTMFKNRDLLAAKGIYYPNLGPNTAHHILATPWINIPEISTEDLHYGSPDAFFEDFSRSYSKKNGVVILSAEVFSRATPQCVNFLELSEKLRAFEQVEVVYVTRRQPELLQSIWLQVAKSGNIPNFNRFFSNALRDRKASGVWLDHEKIYDAVLQGFDARKVRFLSYEIMLQDSRGVLGSFFKMMNINFDTGILSAIRKTQSNPSPSPLLVYIASRARDFGQPFTPDALKRLESSLRTANLGAVSAFLKSEYHAILEEFSTSNENLLARLLKTQPYIELNLNRIIPPNTIWRDEISLEHWIRIAGRI